MAQNRKDFDHNIWLLLETEIHITHESAAMEKGLRAARFSPNRRVNLHTVDESARLMANSIFNILQREKS